MKKRILAGITAVLMLSGCGRTESSVSDISAEKNTDTISGTEMTSAEKTEVPAETVSGEPDKDTETQTEETTMETTQEQTTEVQTTSQPETTQPPTQPSTEEPHDGKLVRMLDYIPDLVVDLRYATDNNFTGQVIYDSPEAYLCYGTVKKLMQVQAKLRSLGYRLVIWDAYRPVEAQQRLWEVYPDPTYVADPRNGITSHSRGNTVDISIAYEDGTLVDMPSKFDEFSTLADRDYTDVPAEQAQNSIMLENIMTAYGFTPYYGEWWHYSDVDIYDTEY